MEMLSGYLNQTIPAIPQSWKPNTLACLANIVSPGSLFNRRESMLKADIHFLWLSWFLESIYDFNLAPENVSYADVLSSVRRGLIKSGFDDNDESFKDVWVNIARLIFTYVTHTQGRSRKQVSKSLKQDLIANCNGKPHCWICGARFSQESISNFLGAKVKFTLSPTVDYMFPRGLKERDFKIEVEHKLPFSLGGGDIDDIDNIGLSCGYCNRHKWKFLSVYDANRNLRTFSHLRLGMVSVPQPYWVIRILALADKCSEAGCTARKTSQQLYVDLVNDLGSATPSNLKVVCRKHIRNPGDRFVNSKLFIEKVSKGRSNIV
ncbi:HNH endonuclease [Vibrio neptunius]|uniref:HNH endonuclease n=1 Tax=Vibrio neptunius TaxID=170651 RepID=A0ABS2ZXL6_9VIBR|nr:HNH endonuclease [Vibrio neptunius]MBN3492223.1 HNH endonuclease [Vibrio neptunius]MBN3514720.1 HNH endonuclease [Vibrio neptunius]MBN3552125.1 HNH endonuclease [Vibrio neptunius]MBN3576679.1 HNH endonuclease [Vibrio neptunius]MCH9870343.1 HNH endonuclease [Vibrio neptunius]